VTTAKARSAEPLQELRGGARLVVKTSSYLRPMQRVDRPLYLLHTDPALGLLLGRLSGQHHHVLPVQDWRGLRQVLRKAPPTAISIVDPYEPSGALSEELPVIFQAFPSASIVAALPGTNEANETIRKLLAWGIAEIIDLLRDDRPAAIGRTLRLVQSRAVHRLLRRALPHGIPSRSRGLLVVAAEIVSAGGQAPEFARALGVDERTVPRWCARADLPPPRRLLAWLRLLIASEILDDPGRSAESAARAAGYAAASSLKTALRKFMSTSPSELRERGAFKTLGSAFAQELFEIRERARAEGKPEAAWLH